MTFEDWLNIARAHFPSLNTQNCRQTSPADDGYNCIAWAAEDTEHWWWPDPQAQKYWPPSIPREETIDAFIRAFKLIGYTQTTNAEFEPGKKKVAIFATSHGKPTHAARQLLDGWWASKLGQQIDIEHELSAVEGPTYGTVTVVLATSAREG